jgi:putative Mg2+ transporter-C (MgtC) family protein
MNIVNTDLICIALAILCGGAIGLEREIRGKSAGLRTNVRICLGAAVFTIISERMAGPGDSATRIAAQIVTGVGFLGAGAVIQDRGGVHGLTTAATIWLVASIGMACGIRLYSLALALTAVSLGILLGLAKLDKAIAKIRKKSKPSDSLE